MLKPKKKFTKKEIQRDPFLDSIGKAQVHLANSRSFYMKIAIGIIVVLLGYNVISQKSSQNSLEANEALGQAMVALDRGDVSNTQFQLETVIADYNGSHSADMANYYLGKIKYESGDYEGAETYLAPFFKDNVIDLLVSPAALMLANISLESGDTKTALSFLEKGIRKSTDKHTRRMIALEKAKLIFSTGNTDGARTIAEDILSEKDVTSVQKQVAEELIGKILG